ncbi:MAG: hypothetical protein GEV12_19140 [Micromonosporaceae bacterium]|nr:hypothetical protein [Micromonosporaceae bacterium]
MSLLVFNSFGEWLFGVVARLCRQLLEEAGAKLEASTAVSFTSGWWVEPESQAVAQAVMALAAVLMAGCLLLALLQGILAGNPAMMLRAVLLEAPISILGIVVLTAVTAALLALTDAASAMVLPHGGATATRLVGAAVSPGTPSVLRGVLLVLLALGTFLVWVELVVREALIYLLVAFAPLLLAARVWPAARGVWHKGVEIGAALVFSKFVIALALGVGGAALGGGDGESELQGLLAGSTLMLTAALTPFALLRLLPGVEAAMGAQGIGRSPGRAAMSALQWGYYGAALGRIAAGAGPVPAATSSGAGDSPPGPAGQLGPGGGPHPAPWRGGGPPARWDGGPSPAGGGGGGPSGGGGSGPVPGGVIPPGGRPWPAAMPPPPRPLGSGRLALGSGSTAQPQGPGGDADDSRPDGNAPHPPVPLSGPAPAAQGAPSSLPAPAHTPPQAGIEPSASVGTSTVGHGPPVVAGRGPAAEWSAAAGGPTGVDGGRGRIPPVQPVGLTALPALPATTSPAATPPAGGVLAAGGGLGGVDE